MKKYFKLVSLFMIIAMCVSSTFAGPVRVEAAPAGEDNPDDLYRQYIRSLGFYVGKVVQDYTQDQSDIEEIDFSNYVDTENKIIRSATDEITWDYDKGVIKVDTPKNQGVTGFLNSAGSFELSNVTIESDNEYATIMVTALDNVPLSSSNRILIQAVTEDKPYGWSYTEGEGGKTITNLGSLPVNVKNISAVVTLKGRSGLKVMSLDPNGYARGEIAGEETGEGIRITLPSDSIYTLVSDSLYPVYEPPQTTSYIWWEGESSTDHNFPSQSTSWFGPHTFPETAHLLSEGNWLNAYGNRAVGAPETYARYQVEVPSDGEYNFWVRKFWKHGPFRWRFDEEDWQICDSNCMLADSVTLRTNVSANWVYLGKVNLEAGSHTFELRLLAGEGESLTACFDAFLLIPGSFTPRGNLKPDAKYGLAEEGYWAFEPDPDSFDDESFIDLSYLNEDAAGQSGYVRREGDSFVLGSGEPVKFWAVDATIDQDRESIRLMARRLAKYGVNMVRAHGALFDGSSPDLSRINPEKLDRLHYFVYAMKQEGIYVNISFYFPLWVSIRPEHGIPGYDTISNKNPFALLQFDPQFQEIYKNWARSIFLTENPYTGLPLAQDPAVAIIEIQNEDSYFFWTFKRDNIPEVQMEKLERKFGAWLESKYGSIQSAISAWGEGTEQPYDDPEGGRMTLLDAWHMTASGHGVGAKLRRMTDQLQFLVEDQRKFYQDMADFFRNEIGTQSIISCSNWTTADNKLLDPLERYTYTAGAVIDRHGYFGGKHEGDAASYSVRVGHVYEDRTALFEPESAITQIFQVENYPHMITETAWPMPNRFKGEAVPMWTIYGGLQGMDAIHFFALGTAEWEAGNSKWPIAVPSILGQFPAFALLYRRGDLAEGPVVVRVTHSLNDLYSYKGSPIYENQALDLLRQLPPPGERPSVSAKRVQGLVVDGRLNEAAWDVSTDVSKSIMGESNNTVQFGVLWDDSYLYIGVRIVDDALWADSENNWEDDSVEVYIDSNHNRGLYYDDYDQQLVLRCADNRLWANNGITAGVLHAVHYTDDGYTVEMALPWANYNISPGEDTVIGLDIGNNDDDDGDVRESQVMWAGTGDNWQSTANYGDCRLLAGPAGPSAVLTAPGSVAPGEEFSVSLGFSEAAGVYARDITIRYDASLFEFVKAEGAQMAPMGLAMVESGSLRLVKEEGQGIIRIIEADSDGLGSEKGLRLVFRARDISQTASGRIDMVKTELGTAPDGGVLAVSPASCAIQVVVMLSGDINNDGRINVADVAQVAYYYGASSGDPNWNEARKADVNGDGRVDLFDLAYVASKVLGK